MVDYTSKPASGGSLWLFILAGGIVLILLYALLAGGGPTTVDPAMLSEQAPAGAEATTAAPSE